MTTATTAPVERKTTSEVTRREPTRSVRYRPNVDIIEKADELLVVADMPGTRPEDIDVNFENGVLTIHGRVRERQPRETNFLLREYGIGDFYRSFEVSESIDANNISAEYSDGVLTLHLPKVAAARPRKIAVKAR